MQSAYLGISGFILAILLSFRVMVMGNGIKILRSQIDALRAEIDAMRAELKMSPMDRDRRDANGWKIQ